MAPIKRSAAAAACLALVLALGASSVGGAEPTAIGGPGIAGQERTLAAATMSVYVAPAPQAARRGTIDVGTPLLVHRRLHAAGCNGNWILIGPSAWTCETSTTWQTGGASSALLTTITAAINYYRIGDHGAIGYSSQDRAEQRMPDAELQPGFFVGVIDERSLGGESFVRTTHGIWIAKGDLYATKPSDFAGIELEQFVPESQGKPSAPTAAMARPGTSSDSNLLGSNSLPVGWIYVDQATPRRTPAGAGVPNVKSRRLTRLSIEEARVHADRRIWYRTNDGWFSEQQLRVPSVAPPPDGVGPNERWLDVDRRSQTLVAYVGSIPVFATLVSTGRGVDTGPTATPAGVFRIWVKLASTDMDNLDERGEAREAAQSVEPYAVEAVPNVMFFHRGYGLHATYWHDAFGTPHSHGCINLSPSDAARLFEFTSPRLLPGWQAVHPSAYDPGTLIRVR